MDRIAGKNDSRIAFDLKGAAFTILVLSLRTAEMNAVANQLAEKVRQAPDFFRQAPVVISMQQLEDEVVDLAMLVNLLRNHGFIPIGMTGGSEEQKQQAAAMELAILAARAGGRTIPEPSRVEEEAEPENDEHVLAIPEQPEVSQPVEAEPIHIITEPVRSGQRVVIRHGDLTILASVGSGAEISAPGSIHVYGALRGRAFAGSDGNSQARIFCQKLEAELVSIADVHLVSEDFPEHLRSKAVQIRLHGGRLHITGL
jgi:septum site-determining protein MinC